MLFKDRKQAGRQLAEALKDYKNDREAIVIALPRGGVVVGFEVAVFLNLALDIVCPRKIGAPFNPEFAIGAITETGEGILSEDVVSEFGISREYIQKATEREMKEAQSRLNRYRNKRPPRQLNKKKVILIDDGLATGSTMRAAIRTVKAENAKEIIMAIPVAPPDTLQALSKEVNKVVCLSSPSMFHAVGQFYQQFEQTTDEEVISLLEKKQFSSHSH